MRIFFFLVNLSLGVAVFFLSLKMLEDTLEHLFGFRLHTSLTKFTSNRVKSFAVGLVITALIQSSSAVGAAMVVLTDAGVLSLTQALGVMLGANVGTTITAQIVALPLEKTALPLCAAGLALRLLGRRRAAGTALFSLGALFFGLSLTTASLSPLLRSSLIHRLLLAFSATPFQAVFLGFALTVLAQSSSAVTSLVVGLVKQNLLPVPMAIGVALGSNVGTVATTLLASVGRSRVSRATACADLFFNLGGVLLVLPCFPWFLKIVTQLSSDPSRQVAHAHTIFNLLSAMVALPFLQHLAGLAWWGAGISGTKKNKLG